MFVFHSINYQKHKSKEVETNESGILAEESEEERVENEVIGGGIGEIGGPFETNETFLFEELEVDERLSEEEGGEEKQRKHAYQLKTHICVLVRGTVYCIDTEKTKSFKKYLKTRFTKGTNIKFLVITYTNFFTIKPTLPKIFPRMNNSS